MPGKIVSGRPHCSCGGELVITEDVRGTDGWRIGFKLRCKDCGTNWTYSGGIYRIDKNEPATAKT